MMQLGIAAKHWNDHVTEVETTEIHFCTPSSKNLIKVGRILETVKWPHSVNCELPFLQIDKQTHDQKLEIEWKEEKARQQTKIGGKRETRRYAHHTLLYKWVTEYAPHKHRISNMILMMLTIVLITSMIGKCKFYQYMYYKTYYKTH